ncbi:tyrosine-type recombinase/integrase [Bifidobacterium sp. SO4]|uniref:tyrosine-type recombinase/integrase n=1 Tax=Bifidobacterium sp. SO4 TaxID=2809030 RepID=UPI001BDC7B12|nr:tyrosine-type recombinase/integrase [Bifidobacterium sp. SO4]MBT1171363.1 tyrosine-type recombinase/integrase [Bifidobacterium sp. SO4]
MVRQEPWGTPESWTPLISEWVGSMRAAGFSEATMKTRRCQISHIARALKVAPTEVTGRGLTAYFGAQAWKRNTRKGYRDTVKRFFAWMQATGQRKDNPIDQLPKVREAPPKPRPCPDREIIAALSMADRRETIMVRLAAECGLRRSEIAAVKGEDVRRDHLGWTLTVIGKGDKQRTIPICDDLAALIRPCAGYLFPGEHNGHLHPNSIGKLVGDLLPDGWTTHTLRHRYATRIYEETHDIYIVCQLLGHSSVATTQRYVAMPASRLRAAAEAVELGTGPSDKTCCEQTTTPIMEAASPVYSAIVATIDGLSEK